MKPIIITKQKNANGNYEFTERELFKLIKEAFQNGVEMTNDTIAKTIFVEQIPIDDKHTPKTPPIYPFDSPVFTPTITCKIGDEK